MKRWLTCGTLVACLALNLAICGCDGSGNLPPAGRIFAASPVFSPSGGVITAPVTVAITSETEGAEVYYTTDGSDPSDTNGTLYTAQVRVDRTMTIRAIAYAEGALPSFITSAVFTLAGNQPPVVDASVSGNILPGVPGQIRIECEATDEDGYIVSVVADLSELDASASQALVRSGNLWTWTGYVIAPGAGARKILLTVTDDGGATTPFEVVLDLGTEPGQIGWKYPTQGPVLSTPAIAADGTVYFGSSDNYLYAVDAYGALLWKTSMDYPVTGAPAIAADGMIYVGADGRLFAVTPEGVIVWSHPTANTIVGSPAIGSRGIVYIGSSDGTLYAINSDGTRRWTFKAGGAITSSPAIDEENTIYFGSQDGRMYAVYPSGSLKWTFATGAAVHSSPAIGPDGTIYFGSADLRVYAVDRLGVKRWEAIRLAAVSASPVLGSDTLYVGGLDGRMAALNPANGQLRWEVQVPGQIRAAAAVTQDDAVYFGASTGMIYALASDGEIWWQTQTGGEVSGSAAVDWDGTIYIGSGDKNLYALYGVGGLADSTWPTFRANLQRTGAVPNLPLNNIAPVFGGMTPSGALVQGQSCALTLTCSVQDVDGSMQAVTADLSSIGGAADQALAKGAGNAWSWTGTVVPSNGLQQPVTFRATDNDGGTRTASSTIFVATSPLISSPAVAPALKWSLATDVTVSCSVTDGDGTVQAVTADLTAINGPAAAALTKTAGATWQWSGNLTPMGVGDRSILLTATDNDGRVTTRAVALSVANRLVISDVAASTPLVLHALSPISVACKVVTGAGTVQSVVADLSPLGGPAGQALNHIGGGNYAYKTALAPVSAGAKDIILRATGTDGLVATTVVVVHVSTEPAVTDMAVVGTLTRNQPVELTVRCKAVDPDGEGIASVMADLTAVGGSYAQALVAGAGDVWSWTGTVAAPAVGPTKITFVATNMVGVEGTGSLDVTFGNLVPVVAVPSLTGVLNEGQAGTVTLTCTAVDPDGKVVSVQADLSAVGGSATQALTAGLANTWSWTGSLTPPAKGTCDVVLLATDSAGGTAAATFGVTVNVGIKWTASLGAAVESSPAIGTDGKIYIATAGGVLYAVDAATGAKTPYPLSGTAALASPMAVSSQAIYVGSMDTWFYQVNPVTGAATRLFQAARGIRSSAAVDAGGIVYVGSHDGNVYGYNVGTDVVTTYDLASRTVGTDPIISSPATGRDGRVWVGSSDGNVYVIDPAAGTRTSYHLGAASQSHPISSSPAIADDGTVWIGSSDGNLYAITATSDPASVPGFFVDGSLTSSPAIGVDGTVYIGSDGGSLFAVNPDGTVKWTFATPLGQPVRSSPAISADGTVYVGCDDGCLYAVDAAGQEQWHFDTGAPVKSSPVIGADGTVYVASTNGDLHAIVGSAPLAPSAWPMFRHDARHLGWLWP